MGNRDRRIDGRVYIYTWLVRMFGRGSEGGEGKGKEGTCSRRWERMEGRLCKLLRRDRNEGPRWRRRRRRCSLCLRRALVDEDCVETDLNLDRLVHSFFETDD
jgi:hypothetical protein